MASRLQQELNAQVPVVTLYKAPTISSLTDILIGEGNEQTIGEASSLRGQKRREKKKKRQETLKRN